MLGSSQQFLIDELGVGHGAYSELDEVEGVLALLDDIPVIDVDMVRQVAEYFSGSGVLVE